MRINTIRMHQPQQERLSYRAGGTSCVVLFQVAACLTRKLGSSVWGGDLESSYGNLRGLDHSSKALHVVTVPKQVEV
jgi:hypothetical protein